MTKNPATDSGLTSEKSGNGPVSHASLLLIASWFGLVTGFGEVSLLGIKKIFLHQLIHFGPDVIWMSPLADLVLFAIPAFILLWVARKWQTATSLRGAGFVFAFLAYLSWLFMYSQLHAYAAMLLAAGLAFQTARVIAKHEVGFQRLVRCSLVGCLAIVIALSAGSLVWRSLLERRVSAQLPAPRPGAPNVLLITLDTVRAQNLSLYGYSRPTSPHLTTLAQRGVRFDKAIATAPWTLPSHASLMTGRWPHELSADWFQSLDDSYPTLAETLSAHGYETAGFVGNTLYCSYETGLNRGFGHFQDYSVSLGEFVLSSSLGKTIANKNLVRRIVGHDELLAGKNAATVNEQFLRWLSHDRDRPFFVFLNYFDAHEVYFPPKPFDGMFGKNKIRNYQAIRHEERRNLRLDWQEMPAAEVQSELDTYDESIAYLDHELGLLFEEMKKRGVLDDTLVIITSDHGEQFGEHRLFMHGNSLYSQLLHVPLVMFLPARIPAGITVGQPVSLRDIPATVLDLAGIADKRLPGDSVARYWRAQTPKDGASNEVLLSELTGGIFGKEWYPAVKGNMASVISERFHYIRNGDRTEELYDFVSDAEERHNLINDSEYQPVLMRLRESLDGRLNKSR